MLAVFEVIVLLEITRIEPAISLRIAPPPAQPASLTVLPFSVLVRTVSEPAL